MGQWSEAKGWDSKCPQIIFLNLYLTCILYLHLKFCVCIWLGQARDCRGVANGPVVRVGKQLIEAVALCCTTFPCYLAAVQKYTIKRVDWSALPFTTVISRTWSIADFNTRIFSVPWWIYWRSPTPQIWLRVFNVEKTNPLLFYLVCLSKRCPLGGGPRIVETGHILGGNLWRFPNVPLCDFSAQFVLTLIQLLQFKGRQNAENVLG